ncbi:MAG: hypothetical protein ACREHC_00510, partial [Candidatus Levyibacteriota bacterium]
MQKVEQEESDFSFKSLFVPFTTIKAIHLIVIIGFIVYYNSLFNGFVWEDKSLIVYNSTGHLFNIFSANNSFNHGGQFRPIAALYSAIAFAFFS